MGRELEQKIRAIVAPPVEAAGYELVALEFKKEQAGWVVRLFIDGPGGTSLDDCERVSREVGPVLDVSDVLKHAYSLEVSSPGLNRPLVTAAHFRKFIGQKAKVRLVQGVAGRRNYSGHIVSVSDDGAQLVMEVDGQQHTLPLTDLEKANLEYEFK